MQQQQKQRNPLPATRLAASRYGLFDSDSWWQFTLEFAWTELNWFLNSLKILIITKMVLVALRSAAGSEFSRSRFSRWTLCLCPHRTDVDAQTGRHYFPPFAVRAFTWGELNYLRLIKLLRKGVRLLSYHDSAAANIKRFHFFVK